MYRLKTLLFAFIIVISTVFPSLAAKEYYVKFMPHDYSNWIWQELPNVTSCKKTSDGSQYIIKYKGEPEPRIIGTRLGKDAREYDSSKEKDLIMTIGVDNVLIFE